MQYRLKKEAVPFFIEKHATAIYSLDIWESLSVDIKALEEVKSPVLFYGHKAAPNSSWLAGWDKDNGSHFHFTVVFPSVQFMEHDKFTNGRMVREMMDRINQAVRYHYDGFVINQTN
jgi:hypothetical protein